MTNDKGLDADLRAANAAIAQAYEAFPYNPDPLWILDPAYTRVIAALFGLNAKPQDVLDIGCGGGTLLQFMASKSDGRVAGVDISASACDHARALFADAGRAADIRCMDILDCTAEDLGQFDLICNVGSLYIAPPPVQRKMLELTGQCLRPGGVALITYYDSLAGQVVKELHDLVQATRDLSAPLAEQIAQARGILQAIDDLWRVKADNPLLRKRLDHLLNTPDANIYHELLVEPVTPLRALDLQAALEPHGMGLLSYLPSHPLIDRPTAAERALTTTAYDLVSNGYHFALFGKWPSPGARQDIQFDAPGVVWTTRLARDEVAGPGHYSTPDKTVSAVVDGKSTQGILDALATGPMTWREACQASAARMAGETFNEDQVRIDAVHLWGTYALSPAIEGEPGPPTP